MTTHVGFLTRTIDAGEDGRDGLLTAEHRLGSATRRCAAPSCGSSATTWRPSDQELEAAEWQAHDQPFSWQHIREDTHHHTTPT